MNEPHGGHLVDNLVERDHYDERGDATLSDHPRIQLSRATFRDAVNLATGRFSPLIGFMTEEDFRKVTRDATLEDGTVWPLPIILDVSADVARRLGPDERVALVGPEGEVVGFLDVADVYEYDAERAARDVFGTDDPDHPGVRTFLSRDDFFVGGEVSVFDEYRYSSRDLRPAESRVLFNEKGWDTVVGFQTRNAPHRGHEYIQKCALELTDGLLIHPKLGEKKSGDYRDEVISEAYDRLVTNYYYDQRVVFSVFPTRMRYAGPREAIFDAIVRKNQGCTHFIVGRDHSGVGDYYDSEASRNAFERIGDIGIEPMLFDHAFYCRTCDGMCSDKICPHDDDQRVYPSGTGIRESIRAGESPSSKIMRPEVSNYVLNAENPFVEE